MSLALAYRGGTCRRDLAVGIVFISALLDGQRVVSGTAYLLSCRRAETSAKYHLIAQS